MNSVLVRYHIPRNNHRPLILRPQADRAFNVASYFDPFSRYIPLRVEARLDDVLMDHLRQERVSVQSTSTAESARTSPANRLRRHVAVMSAVAASPNTSFLSHEAVEPAIAWQAARARLPYVDVGGVRLRNPHILAVATSAAISTREPRSIDSGSPESLSFAGEPNEGPTLSAVEPPLPPITPPSAIPPGEGFVVGGDNIELFGNSSLTARFEIWEGPAPDGIVVTPDKPAIVQRATLLQDLHLSAIIPALQGTAFDNITFRNMSILRQNYPFEATQGVGLHFTAELVIDESCGTLHDVLSTVLRVDVPVLRVRTSLGADIDWTKPLEVHSFTLEGIFAGIKLEPLSGLTLTSIGVRLFGIRTLVYDPKPRTTLEYGFAVFGSMDVKVPSSVVPLTLDYEIQEHGGQVFLAADVGEWRDPLGAKGLTVSLHAR